MAEIEPQRLPISCEAQRSSCDDFLALFSRHSRRIYGFIRTLVIDTNDANDVYQSTTACLWQKFDSFSPGTSFFAWACQIAQREVLKYRHQKNRHRHFPEELVDLLAANFRSRVEELDRREQALGECLQRLRHEDQVLIEQRYFQDRKPKEIAESQSRSVFSIYRSLSRIHDQLLHCVGRVLKESV
jgi:RNA polymerase sigma-70 factor, ECF subfamily